MQYQQTCTNCGKTLTIGPEDAGQTVVCGACGTRLRVPREAQPPGWVARNEIHSPAAEQTPSEPTTTARPVSRTTSLSRGVVIPIAAGAVILSLAAGLLIGRWAWRTGGNS